MDPRLGVAPLTPLAQLDRAADYFPDRAAFRFDGRTTTYDEMRGLTRRVAADLRDRGVEPGDRVALLARNVPLSLLAHFAVPYAGATLVALNHRLAGGELNGILRHAGPRLLLAQPALADLAGESVAGLDVPVVDGDEALAAAPADVPTRHPVTDELGLISLNYTSGTTGAPKGVMYRHRGAYLQALAMAYHLRLELGSVYLWTLPMFHCNGWAFPWAVAAAGATSLVRRHHRPRPAVGPDPQRARHALLRSPHVAHRAAHQSVRHAGRAAGHRGHRWRASHTGSDPPGRAARPARGAPVRADRDLRPFAHLRVAARVGRPQRGGTGAACRPTGDPQHHRAPSVTLEPVAGDQRGLAEVTIEGNTVMAGYYRDDGATADASIAGVRFRTGDLGVQHDDRYYQLQDRAKDIIISGGENISSIEVERVLAEHPAVSESAVVARPDEKWGEVPVAYVTLADSGPAVTEEELIEFVRSRIARFKAPKQVVFGPLPKTATGKIQKFELRQRAVQG